MEPDAVEIRVLGCLIEKQRTTPDAYPLTLNALRLACNQSTNRDPVVDYAPGQIQEALFKLGPRRWTRNTSTSSSRTAKYRHLLDEALGLSPAELSLLAVLMLRGPQTPGELNQRAARMFVFADLDAVEQTLLGLYDRELVTTLERRPGQKEIRWVQLIGGDGPAQAEGGASAAAPPVLAAAAPAVQPGVATPPPAVDDGLRAELAALRDEVAELREALATLRTDLGA